MDIDIRGPNDLYEGEVTVRIYEESNGRTHSAGVSVLPENARILNAAKLLYKALAMYYDFSTPSGEADRAARHALELAEGNQRPKRRLLPSESVLLTAEPEPRESISDDILWQEIFSLREQLKIAASIVKSYAPPTKTGEFLASLGHMDFQEYLDSADPEMPKDTLPFGSELFPSFTDLLRSVSRGEPLTEWEKGFKAGKIVASQAGKPEPCEDAREPREPGELIIQGDCPCCGNPLKLMVGDDEGEVTVLGLDSKGTVRETFWEETKRDAYATMVADKRAETLRAQVETLREALKLARPHLPSVEALPPRTKIEVGETARTIDKALAATEPKP